MARLDETIYVGRQLFAASGGSGLTAQLTYFDLFANKEVMSTDAAGHDSSHFRFSELRSTVVRKNPRTGEVGVIDVIETECYFLHNSRSPLALRFYCWPDAVTIELVDFYSGDPNHRPLGNLAPPDFRVETSDVAAGPISRSPEPSDPEAVFESWTRQTLTFTPLGFPTMRLTLELRSTVV